MIDSEKMLSDIFSISEKIYKDMSDDISTADHSDIFEHLTMLGKILSGAERTVFWKWDNCDLWTRTCFK